MIVFRDVFSGDDLFDDSFRREEVDGIVYCVTGQYAPVYATHEDGAVTVRTAVDIVEKYGLQVAAHCVF